MSASSNSSNLPMTPHAASKLKTSVADGRRLESYNLGVHIDEAKGRQGESTKSGHWNVSLVHWGQSQCVLSPMRLPKEQNKTIWEGTASLKLTTMDLIR